MRDLPLRLNYLPKASSPNTITLRGRFPHLNLVGGTQTVNVLSQGDSATKGWSLRESLDRWTPDSGFSQSAVLFPLLGGDWVMNSYMNYTLVALCVWLLKGLPALKQFIRVEQFQWRQRIQSSHSRRWICRAGGQEISGASFSCSWVAQDTLCLQVLNLYWQVCEAPGYQEVQSQLVVEVSVSWSHRHIPAMWRNPAAKPPEHHWNQVQITNPIAITK